ncbi:MAG TPA: thioesterase family protein [Phycisphaerae bacterium]|nr:thioesterase family protein [Phycisphaerae bacterium]
MGDADMADGGGTTTLVRVRYSETDQMGTFYNSRALEWFECGRTEFLRGVGVPYAEMERRGVMLPLVEAHVEYLGRARYDDLLKVTTTAAILGKARIRFGLRIAHADSGRAVAAGYTVHAIASPEGKPIRPPEWFLDAIRKVSGESP